MCLIPIILLFPEMTPKQEVFRTENGMPMLEEEPAEREHDEAC